MGTYAFPTDILNSEDYGHLMIFTAYSPQSARVRATGAVGQRQILDQFLLYVPGAGNGANLSWIQKHEYDEVKMSRIGTGAAAGAMSAILGIDAGTIQRATQAGAGLFRKAINPYVEVLYRGTNLRSYMFSFMFVPQSETDSRMLYGNGPGTGLLNRIRFHAAPDAGAGGDSLLFTSPSEWEIDFLYRVPGPGAGSWAINEKIPKMAKGVINDIEVDYNPDSEFSTFEQGDPTSARLMLTFTEMEIIDKTRIGQGY